MADHKTATNIEDGHDPSEYYNFGPFRGVANYLTLVALVCLLTMVFARSWQMFLVGGLVSLGVAAIAIWNATEARRYDH